MPSWFTPLMTVYVLCLAFLLGGALGSFLDCAAGRYVRKEPFLKGRSHCDACGATLDIPDLIPVFSWLFLRGKCRRCGAKIGPRCVVVEALCGAVFVTTLWRFGFGWQTVETLALGCILVWLALVDLDTMELPGIPMVFAAMSFLAFLPAYYDPIHRLWWGILGAVCIGGGVLAVSLIADKVMGRETMGGGDIKLLALLGLYLGPDGGLLLLILACVVGLVLAALWKTGRGQEFPFGPAIALAAWPALLLARPILEWYMSLF